MADGAPPVWDEVPNNVLIDTRFGDQVATDRAFATADHVVGMDLDEGRSLLAVLLDRATTPDRVYRHEWSVGDLIIWDNTGVMHRVQPYDASSAREMHRTTMSGDEPIQSIRYVR